MKHTKDHLDCNGERYFESDCPICEQDIKRCGLSGLAFPVNGMESCQDCVSRNHCDFSNSIDNLI